MLYTKVTRKGTVSKFLREFLTGIEDNNTAYGGATYYNKECTEIHCKAGKWRGFDDILELVKTYYPTITKKKLMHILVTMKPPEGYKTIDFGVCAGSGILRYMFYRYELAFNIYKVQPHQSKYSWEKLFKLLDINTNDEFFAYKNKYNKPKKKK